MIEKNNYLQMKNQVIEYGNGLCTIEELDSFSNHISEKLADFRPTLMIYGAYNAGKSTLVNALFGKDEYAKTGDAPETKEVHEYEYNGFTIFDTPGLNARDDDDIVTTEHLNKSEIILFVISNNGSLEEEFVYNKISEVVKANKPIIIVLNNKSGIDMNSVEATEIINKVSQNLTKIGDRHNINKIENKVQVCMVNAKSALRAKLETKNIMLKKSNILVLEEMIDNCLINSGQKEVVNALNIYIKQFIENLISQIDNKIDNVQLKKLEELITYIEKLKQSSDIKSKNIVDKKMLAVAEDLASMILSGNVTESALTNYIENSILDINEQISQLVANINNNLSTKIGEFSKDFEELTVNDIHFNIDTDDNSTKQSAFKDQILNQAKNMITNKEVVTKAAKQVLTTAKEYLPKVIMKGKGPAWISKAAGKIAIGVSVVMDAYSMYSAFQEHNEMVEKQRQITLSAKNNAQSIADSVKTSLYGSIDEIIGDIFNELIINFKEHSSSLSGDNSQLLTTKSNLISILNRL